jgi:hypothetical protein
MLGAMSTMPMRTMARPMVGGAGLTELIKQDPVDRQAIAAYLDGVTHAERVAAIRSVGGTKLQARLYEAVATAPRVSLGDLVPPDAPPLREVIFEGKNSLPAFTLFQKRFCRPTSGSSELWGYNHQTLAWLTGPGYFVVHEDGSGAAIDYRNVPPTHPPSWPEIHPNSRGLSRFVYNNMVDYLRRVSADVFIGRAYRGGKPQPNYFLLCREA